MGIEITPGELDTDQLQRIAALREAAEVGKGTPGPLTGGGATKMSAGELVYLAEWICYGRSDPPDADPDTVEVRRSTLSYAVTALEGSSDRGDQFAAHEFRVALGEEGSP